MEQRSISDEMPPLKMSELQLLSQVMSLYPAHWDNSTKRLLLMDMTSVEKDVVEIHARLDRMRETLLLPLIRIVLSEREALKVNKESSYMMEQKLQASLMAAEKEKDSAIKKLQDEVDQSMQQNMLIEILLSDMDKMAKASERHKKEIQRLEHTLFIKDLQIQRLESDKENLLAKLLSQTTTPESFNQIESWSSSTGSSSLGASTPFEYDCSSSVSSIYNFPSEEIQQKNSFSFSRNDGKQDPEAMGLLQLALAAVWNEGMSSAKIVQDCGLSSFPVAVIHFWFGLASRIVTQLNPFHVSEVASKSSSTKLNF